MRRLRKEMLNPTHTDMFDKIADKLQLTTQQVEDFILDSEEVSASYTKQVLKYEIQTIYFL